MRDDILYSYSNLPCGVRENMVGGDAKCDVCEGKIDGDGRECEKCGKLMCDDCEEEHKHEESED